MLSHQTAAELSGLGPSGGSIHVTVPHGRRPQFAARGVIVHQSSRAAASRHPSRLPPQTRVEETVIDLTQAAGSLAEAISWLARAAGCRITTGDRLVAALRLRPRARWRRQLEAALGDVVAGCQSLLEVYYLRLVERAHRLPAADRQVRTERGQYDDVRYPAYGAVVELDGRAAHPSHERFRDLDRDNATVASGRSVLRYGWSDVTERPCGVALQVVRVLRAGGWNGTSRPCRRPDCAMRSSNAVRPDQG